MNITSLKFVSLFLLLSSLVLATSGFGITRSAVSSGNWSSGLTWSGGVVPSCGDSVLIGAGIVIQMTAIADHSVCNGAMYVYVGGTLNFQTGKKLRLPCGSKVVIGSGGLISAGTGGGNSNLIDICNYTVWHAAQGNLAGPATLQFNPLPVQLIHFSTSPNRDGVMLSWLTASEINNRHFVIEKGKDGILFEELGRVDGAGTTSTINSYQFTDKNPYEGLQYYRLVQHDYDGRKEVSRMVAVRWNSMVDFHVYPNPTRGEIYANISPSLAGQKGSIIINNANGKLHFEKNIEFDETTNGIKLLSSKESLKPGNYLITLNVNDKSYSQFIMSK